MKTRCLLTLLPLILCTVVVCSASGHPAKPSAKGDETKDIMAQVIDQMKKSTDKINNADSFKNALATCDELGDNICPLMKKIKDQNPGLFKKKEDSMVANLDDDVAKQILGEDLYKSMKATFDSLGKALEDSGAKFKIDKGDSEGFKTAIRLYVAFTGDCGQLK